MNFIKNWEMRNPEGMKAVKEKFEEYRDILFNKPTYNDNEVSRWFAFMSECSKEWMLGYYAVIAIASELIEKNGQGKRFVFYKLGKNYMEEDNYVAFAYVDKGHLGIDWQLREIGIDTIDWSVAVNDTESGRIFNFPMTGLSSQRLCTILAQLRQIEPSEMI